MSENNLENTPEELWQGAVALLRDIMTTEQERSQWERYYPMFVSREIVDGKYVIGLEDQFHVDWIAS